MMQPTPLRPDDQVAGGFLVMSLGGQSFEVRVLSMAANRRWIARLREVVLEVAQEAGNLDGIDDWVDLLASNAEVEMDLLIDYDRISAEAWECPTVLPEREWIDTHATDRECYEGIKRVAAAAFPKGPDLLRIVPELMPALMTAVQRGAANATVALISSKRTSSSPPSTESEPRPTSKPASPMSSSSSTPRKPRSGARARASRN